MATLARESRSANSCIDCLSVCARYPQLHQPVRCAVKRASCSKAGPELTDNEAGYGHSMILVNSDDSCDLRPVSMMCRAKMWETKLKARSGAWPDFRCLDSRSQDRHLGNRTGRPCVCSHVTPSWPLIDTAPIGHFYALRNSTRAGEEEKHLTDSVAISKTVLLA